MILEAETDKASQEIPVTRSGVLARIVAQPGKTVKTQEPIAVLTEQGETLPEDFSVDTGASGKKADEPAPERQGSGVEQKKATSVPALRVRISPVAKKLAKELNVDYSLITPSKPEGRIEKTDLLEYARGAEAAGDEVVREAVTQQDKNLIPLSGIRKTIATRMSESVRTTARAVLFTKVDASRLIEWRNRLKESGKKVSYDDLIVYLSAKALRDFPQMNSRIEGENIRIMKEVNIGVAVDTERGLLVPVIRDADKKDVVKIADESRQKIGRAIAEAYAQFGAKVACVDILAEDSRAVSGGIEKCGGCAFPVVCDVSRAKDVRKTVETSLKGFGAIDILVNNAGIGMRLKAEDMTDEIWDRVLDVNLKGTFLF